MPVETTQPNILFLQTDQHRWDWTGMHPTIPVRTPNLERLADRGTHFTNAVCPAPVCNPSRACLASGYVYDRCGVPANNVDYPLDVPTYYRRLRDEAGYHVMGCGKFDLQTDFPLDVTGDDGIERWGFSDGRFNPAKNNTLRRIIGDANGEPRDPYTAFLDDRGMLQDHLQDYLRRNPGSMRGNPEDYSPGMWTATFPTTLPDEAYYDTWITQIGLSLLDDAPADRPWFLEVNFQNPHDPWDITERMYDLYRNPRVDFPEPIDSSLDVAPETHNEVRRNYSAMVEHLDECLGEFVSALEASGELEDTLIVFGSDHGEMLGDYGQWSKQSPLQPSVGVPLVAAGPGVADRDECDAPVTTLDLHATFLEYAGVTPDPDVDSRSMTALLVGDADAHRDVVYSALSSWRLVYDGRYKLIRGYDPQLRHGDGHEPMHVGSRIARLRRRERPPILFDVTNGESENVADRHPDVVDDLDRRMADVLAAD